MEDLNIRAKQVLELMKKYSKDHGIKTLGSDFMITDVSHGTKIK